MVKKQNITNTKFKRWLFLIPLLLISHSLLTANTANQWTNYHPNSQTILSKSASDNQYDPNLDKPVVYEFNKQWYKWLAAKEKEPSNVYDGFVANTEKFTVDISNLTFQDQNLINQTVFEFELGGIDATINLPQPCQIKTPSFGISNIGGHCPSYQKYDIFGDKTTIKIEGKQLSSTSHQSIKFFDIFFNKFFVWHRDWFHAEFLIKVKLSEDQKSLIFWFYRKVESYDGHYSGDWASKGVAGFKLKKLTITKGFSYKEIYDQFHKNFSKPFSLVSNEGPSILTTNNRRKIEKELAKNLNLPPKLQNHFIVNHAFEDGSSPKVITTVTFKPQNQGQVKWVFQKPISVKLADQYYQKKIEERLKITPGQIAKIDNGKQILVDDIPKKIEANGEEIWEYHTSAFLHFTPDLNNNEVLFVNGEKVGILNNIFTYQFQDQRYDFWTKKKEDKGGGVRNKYVIEIKRQNDLNVANQSNTILKKSIVINGIINPEYNPKINPETGIISQILWVNQPSPVPFASDPLNEVGLFLSDQPQTGFLAEGMVVAKGIIEKWNGNQTVSRKPFNEKLIPTNNGEKLLTKPEDENQHQSTEGNWYYLGKKDDLYSQKFVKIIGEKEKTTDFLSTVDPKYAVNFWSTFHGFHLRSFLKNYYSFTDQEIQRMNYENVLFFWNEYVFLTKQQRIAIPKQSFNLIDFHHYQLTTIKVNQKEERQLKPTVLTQIQQQLSSQGLILNVDYEINPYDHQLWQRLTNFTNSNKHLEQTLHLYAKIPNSKIYGQKQIKIINDANLSQEKLIDLSKITFPLLKLNINDADQLAKTIKAYVTTMTKKYQLQADQDYQILLLNNKTWKDLVVGKNNSDTNFQVQIQATDQSQKTIGFNTFLVENSTSFPEVINPEINNDKIKTIDITKEQRRKIGGEILNNVDAINTSINQIPITFNNQFFPKIEDVNNGLENVAKELATNIKTLNQTLSQYIGNYKANPALLKTIKDSDNNDENLKKLVAKINELYKTYQVIKKSIPSLFGPKNVVDSLPSLQKIAKYDPTIPKNTPPPQILSQLPSPLLQYVDFSKTEKGVYWGFTVISFTLFISLLYGIKRILKIDILRYGRKKYYFLGLTVISALLTSLAGSYLLVSLLTIL